MLANKDGLCLAATNISWKQKIEREAIVLEKVGINYLTSGQENRHNTLLLLLRKWDWIELVDKTVQRPFAYFMSPNGRTENKTQLLYNDTDVRR